MQRYWNATLYLSAGMIYLRDNPLLREPLKPEHVKRRLLGHWGSDPGMSFVYIHLNRLIKKYDLDVIFLAGPGHGAPALISNVYLEGAYSEIYSEVSEDTRACAACSSSSLSPAGSAPLHAGDARLDSRRRRARLFGVARLRRGLRQPRSHRHRHGRRRRSGDRAARHGVALEQVSQSRARRCGAAGAAPQRLQDRKSDHPCPYFARGAGVAVRWLWIRALFCRGVDPETMHQAMAATLDHCVQEIRRIQQEARANPSEVKRPRWPMIVLRSPKGWTGPSEVDGHKVEGFWRAHQVPLAGMHRSRASETARGMAAQLPPGGAVRRERPVGAGASRRSLRKVRAAWARTRMRTAGCCARRCVTGLHTYAVETRSRADRSQPRPMCSPSSCAMSSARIPTTSCLQSRRKRVQPAGRDL